LYDCKGNIYLLDTEIFQLYKSVEPALFHNSQVCVYEPYKQNYFIFD